MVSAGALRHLGVSARNKEKVEVYFDVSGVLKTLNSMKAMTGGGSSSSSSFPTGPMVQSTQLNDTVTGLIAQLLPSRSEIIRILRDEANLPINSQN